MMDLISTSRQLLMLLLLMLAMMTSCRTEMAFNDDNVHHQSARVGTDWTETVDSSAQYVNCTARQAKRNYRYASIRDDILRKLRLTAPPNITTRHLPAIPQLQSIISEMCRQKEASCSATDSFSASSPTSGGSSRPSHYESIGIDEEEDFHDDDLHATTIKILLFPIQLDEMTLHISQMPVFRRQICQFRFQPDLTNSVIVNVTLGVYIRRSTFDSQLPYMATWLLIYDLQPSSSSDILERKLIHRRRIFLNDEDTGRWHHFTLRNDVIRRWIQQPDNSGGLFIQATDARGDPLAVIQPQNTNELPYKPYLEAMVSNRRETSRTKRMTDLKCEEQSAEQRCCRYPLVVDFDKFGWDWVIVPRRYSAYYCSGDCPFLYMQTYPHTHIRQQQQQQLRQSTSATAGGGPCCSPRRVSAISMLYYDEYMNIVYGRLPDMVVEQCGCA